MNWSRWPLALPALPATSDDDLGPSDEGSRDGEEAAAPDGPNEMVVVPDDQGTGCWHVRPLPGTTTRILPPVHQSAELHRGRPGQSIDLSSIGLPDHLIPPQGGIFRLLDLFDRLPRPRIPALRTGDDVAVVAVEPAGSVAKTPCLEPTSLAAEIADCLRGADPGAESVSIHMFVWPDDAQSARPGTAESALLQQVRALHARLELLVVHPDCPGTTAYPACRALPGAQLYLRDALDADRPAAPLSWGAPIAFIDGRAASPAVLAAVFADRLAGGVA